MATILKMTMGVKQRGGFLDYIWPDEYVWQKVSVTIQRGLVNKAARDAVISSLVLVDGDMVGEDVLIGVVSSEDAAAFLVSPDIVELTEEEAATLGSEWWPQSKRITDPEVILTVLEKYRTGATPTTDELKAIDPHDATTMGVNMGQPYTYRLTKAQADRG